MTGLNAGRTHAFKGGGKKEVKEGTIVDIKKSPERGYKRLIAIEKTGMRKSFAIDISMKEANRIKRKKAYSFKVEEKSEERLGGSVSRMKEARFKSYYCDETPEEYVAKSKESYKSFGGSSRLNGSRTKF